MKGIRLDILPIILGAVHLLLCIWVASIWLSVYEEYDDGGGWEFNTTYRAMRMLDIPVSWLAHQIATWAAISPTVDFIRKSGYIRFMWVAGSLLLVLGTVQWFLIGEALRWLDSRYGRRAVIVCAVFLLVWASFVLLRFAAIVDLV